MENNQNQNAVPAASQYAARQYATPQYVAAQPQQVIFVDANGQPLPVQPCAAPVAVTPQYAVQEPKYVQVPVKEANKKIRRKIRSDMGAHGGILLVSQLVNTVALVIALSAILIPTIISAGFSSDFDINSISDITAMTSFPMLLAMAIAQLCGNTIAFIPFAKKRGIRPFSTFPGGEKPQGGMFWRAAVIMLGLNFLWGYTYMGLSWLFPSVQNSAMSMEMPLDDIRALIVYCLMVCVIAPITEEFMFRGVLLHSLRRYGDRFAIITTAIFFGLLHGNLNQTPMAFLLGLILGYVAVKTGSIWYTIALHFINNTFVTMLGIAEMKLPQYETIFLWVENGMGIIFALCAIALLIIRRRRIAFPKDSDAVKNGPVRHRYATFFGAFWNIVFVLLLVGMIVLTISPSYNQMQQEAIESVTGGFISLSRLFF